MMMENDGEEGGEKKKNEKKKDLENDKIDR